MSETHIMARTGPHRPAQGRRHPHRPVSLEGPPTPQEQADHAERHKGDAADRFTLYTPEQIAEETRNVRLDITFGDIIKVRDQFEMIIEAAQTIIRMTRNHDPGSIRQRIETHREADALRRTLARFNGKKPRTSTLKPDRS